MRTLMQQGHHMVARFNAGPHLGQALMVCDAYGKYHPRVVLESTPIVKGVHIMRLARELADAFSNEKSLQSWDGFDNIVFHAKYNGSEYEPMAYLFASTIEHDYQFGVVYPVDDLDVNNLANLICQMLNGRDISHFLINEGGEVKWGGK